MKLGAALGVLLEHATDPRLRRAFRTTKKAGARALATPPEKAIDAAIEALREPLTRAAANEALRRLGVPLRVGDDDDGASKKAEAPPAPAPPHVHVVR